MIRNIKCILFLLVIIFSTKSSFADNPFLHSKHFSISQTRGHCFNGSEESKFYADFESFVLKHNFLSVTTFCGFHLNKNHKTIFICKKAKRYKKATRVKSISIDIIDRFSSIFRYYNFNAENKKKVAVKQSSDAIKYSINDFFNQLNPAKNI